MLENHLFVNISQKALIVVDGKVLLVREADFWELPGGRINDNETDLIEALNREIKEELSAEIEPKELYYAHLFRRPKGDLVLILVYEAELTSSLDTIKVQEGEILDWKLFSKEELGDLEQIYGNSKEPLKKFLSTQ